MQVGDRFNEMLKPPKATKVERIERNETQEWYFLQERIYCKYCDCETQPVIENYLKYDYWFVKYCSECSGTQKTVFERQQMPFCEQCEEPFKFDGDSILQMIYDVTGKRICASCKDGFLKNAKNISSKNE